MVPDKVTPTNKFAMRGYQCDIDGQNRYTGNNYEEKGRLFLAVRGQVTRMTGTRKPIVLSTLADDSKLGAAGHRRLECRPPDRPRQCADAQRQRPPDVRRHR